MCILNIEVLIFLSSGPLWSVCLSVAHALYYIWDLTFAPACLAGVSVDQ